MQTPHFHKLLYLVPISSVFILMLIPFPQQIGLSFRYGFTTTIVFTFILLALVYFLKVKNGLIARASILFLLFAMPLSGLWNSGASEPSLVSGLFPYSDAGAYYSDSWRLLSGLKFQSSAINRPMFSGVLSGLITVTNQNIQAISAILLLVTAWSVFLVSEELANSEGIFVAVLFSTLVFLFYRRFVGLLQTEHLGLAFGLLSLAMLIRGHKRNEPNWVLGSLLTLSFGLNIRAGTMFLLPALAVWMGFRFQGTGRFSWKYFIWGLMACALGFLVNMIIFKVAVSGNSPLFANFIYTLYGIVRGGGGYTLIYREHPEIFTFTKPEQVTYVLNIVVQSMRSDPGLFIQGVIRAYTGFLDPGRNYGMFGFVNPGEEYIYALHDYGNVVFYRWVRYGLALLCSIGFLHKVIRQKNERLLVILIWAGLLLSVMFVPPGDADRMRAYATSIPFIVWFPSSGLHIFINHFKIFHQKTSEKCPPSELLKWTAAVLVLVTFLTPLLVSWLAKKPVLPEASCPDGQSSYYINIRKGSYIVIHKNLPKESTHLPDIGHNTFNLNIHNLPDSSMVSFLDTVPANNLLTVTINRATSNLHWFFIPVDLLERIEGDYFTCGQLKAKAGLPISPVMITYVEKLE